MGELSAPSILLLGSTGQVGWELARSLAPLGTVIAPVRAELDLAQLDKVRAYVLRHRPSVIVNAAAYTAVDAAEADPEGATLLNTDLPALLAAEAKSSGSVLVHYSTDYVFDGNGTRPYREDDPTGPLNVYGRTKLGGDEAILASGAEAYIFRVAWVYGMRGKNFLRTMQRLAGERDELRVVADQWGTPTWSRTIADVTAAALGRVVTARREGARPPEPGVYHVASPDATTWYGFASVIVGMSSRPNTRVVSISSEEYPTAAKRPRYSVLSSAKFFRVFDLSVPPWENQVSAMINSPAIPCSHELSGG